MTYTQIDRDLFNYDIPKNIDGFRSLVELHYYLSSRDESDYWKYLTEDISYDNLPFLKATGDSRTYYEGGNSNPASLFIVAGMNYSCFSKAFVMRKPNEAFNKNKREFENYVKELERNVERLPSTYKFLLKHIY